MDEATKSRNQAVDILRGIAMLMVVLGHTMTGCTVNSQESFLFNVIWTLQMPLFILISGYVTRYSHPILSFKSYGRFIWKRTLAYLLPWVVWTFVIRGVIFQQSGYLDTKYVFYNMDAGYWFLFTIWTISMIFGASQIVSEKLCSNKSKFVRIATLAVLYVFGMGILAGTGIIMGLSFCCIKLTLYYMPFYFAGYLFGQVQSDIEKLKCGKSILEVTVAVCLVVWLVLMQRYSFYEIGDSGFGIILRATASLCGCIAVCGLVTMLIFNSRRILRGGDTPTVCRCALVGNLHDTLSAFVDGESTGASDVQHIAGCAVGSTELCNNGGCCHSNHCDGQHEQSAQKRIVWQNFLAWIGQHSLEIYVLHGFMLNLLKVTDIVVFDTLYGIGLMAINYCATVILTGLITFLIGQSRIIRIYMFGKMK